MPINDGEPADDGDIWFRVLTEIDNKYIRQGKIYPSAFKGKNVIAPPAPEKKRPWDHELSGRLRSLSDNVVAEGIAYCVDATAITKQTKNFGGVMFCNVPDAHQLLDETISTRIHYTPRSEDKAHADLTFTGSAEATEEVFDRLRLWLCDLVTGLYPAQIARLMPQSQTARGTYSVPE